MFPIFLLFLARNSTDPTISEPSNRQIRFHMRDVSLRVSDVISYMGICVCISITLGIVLFAWHHMDLEHHTDAAATTTASRKMASSTFHKMEWDTKSSEETPDLDSSNAVYIECEYFPNISPAAQPW